MMGVMGQDCGCDGSVVNAVRHGPKCLGMVSPRKTHIMQHDSNVSMFKGAHIRCRRVCACVYARVTEGNSGCVCVCVSAPFCDGLKVDTCSSHGEGRSELIQSTPKLLPLDLERVHGPLKVNALKGKLIWAFIPT